MKLLLVFLACLAAANAYTYSYSYYCQKRFIVYPASSCYRYTIKFPSTWCTTKYYAPVLKVYPGEKCGQAGWSEKSVADVTTEVKNCLKAALVKMSAQMYTDRNEWVRKICTVHEEYKANFKKYITQYYEYQAKCYPYVIDTAARDARIKEYNDKLNKIKMDLFLKYNAAISEKIATLKAYHEKIIKAATECLNTRLAKIAEYKAAVAKKIDGYVAAFQKFHMAIAMKNRDYYRALLTTLFKGYEGDWWINVKASISVSYYYSAESSKVYTLVREYRAKLMEYQQKLVTYYTCAYRCYMSNACLRFYKRSYYNCSRSLGCWYRYKSSYCVSRYCIRPFNVCYRPITYKCLRTCDVNAAAGSVAKLIEELKKKRDEVLMKRSTEFFAWKSKWIGYHLQYKAQFAKIVKERHDLWLACVRRQYLACSKTGVLTPEQMAKLAQLKKELEDKAAEVCAKYYRSLGEQITACYQKYLKEVAAYRKSVDDLIAKVQAQFDACIAKRNAAIAAYKKKLEESRNAKRKALYDSIWKAKRAHWAEFNKLLVFYHGERYYNYYFVSYMRSCYADVIIRKCNVVMSQFDQHWRELLPKLVMHYSCGYKCSVRACMPSYRCGGYYTWVYKLPTYGCYSYKYTYYKSYYCY